MRVVHKMESVHYRDKQKAEYRRDEARMRFSKEQRWLLQI